jgi:hypothetical protein
MSKNHCWHTGSPLFSLAAISLFAAIALADEESVFYEPIRLKADGQFIDSGDAWGHSGPCLSDVDGDGLSDLVVGDFSGKFRFYRNVGSNTRPNYRPPRYLKAGKKDAQVPIYCCIGSSPHFADLDGDGLLDLISGSYDPGACYLFRGLGNGIFAARKTMVDKGGNVILRKPDQQQVYESFGTWVATVDWDDDGDLDLLLGGFDGKIMVRFNEGSRDSPQFSVDNVYVQVNEEDLKVPGGVEAHAALAVVDWDNDRLWDILSGSDSGAVYWFRNTGQRGKPSFEPPQTLVKAHHGSGYDELLIPDEEPVPGIRSQIAAADYDADGDIDLLVGDFRENLTAKPGLLPAQRAEMHEIYERLKEARRGKTKLFDALVQSHSEQFPVHREVSDEADAAWQEKFAVMTSNDEWKLLVKRYDDAEESLSRFLLKPKQEGRKKYLTSHGFVWLFRRKQSDEAFLRHGEPEKSLAGNPKVREAVLAKVSVVPSSAKPGDTVTIELRARMRKGWHINAVGRSPGPVTPTSLELVLPASLVAEGAWGLPPSDVDLHRSSADRVYAGEVVFYRKLKISSDTSSGLVELKCVFAYQACDAVHCLRPARVSLQTNLQILPP